MSAVVIPFGSSCVPPDRKVNDDWMAGDNEVSVVIRRHLAALELAGHPASTVYARFRALLRTKVFLDGKPLLDATHGDLMAWRASLTVGPDTIRSYVTHVRQFYVWAVREGLLPDNPAGELPVPRRTRRLPRPADEQDLLTAVTSAPPRIRPWLVLGGWVGLRAKEIALLRRESVLDTARPPLVIVAADATKGRTERVVPLSGYVLDELQRAGLPGSGWIFRRGDGRPGPNTPGHVSRMTNTYLHEIGLPITLHQLRHRFATRVLEQTGNLRLVQDLLGHASPESTAGYTALCQADAAAAVEMIPAPGRLRVVRSEPAGTRADFQDRIPAYLQDDYFT